MSESDIEQEIDALCQAYLAEELDPASAERLTALLEHDPEQRRRFVAAMRFSCGLATVSQRLIGQRHSVRRRQTRRSRPRSRTPWRFVALGLAAALLAVLFWPQQEDPQPAVGSEPMLGAVVEAIQGGGAASLLDADGQRRAAQVGDRVVPGTGIALETGVSLRIALAGAVGSIALTGPAQLQFPIVHAAPLQLEHGRLSAEITRRPDDQPFVIATPNGSSTVLGTRFSLQAEQGWTHLEVEQGRVQLGLEDQVIVVAAKQHAFASRDPAWRALSMRPFAVDSRNRQDVFAGLLLPTAAAAYLDGSFLSDHLELTAGHMLMQSTDLITVSDEHQTAAITDWPVEAAGMRFLAEQLLPGFEHNPKHMLGAGLRYPLRIGAVIASLGTPPTVEPRVKNVVNGWQSVRLDCIRVGSLAPTLPIYEVSYWYDGVLSGRDWHAGRPTDIVLFAEGLHEARFRNIRLHPLTTTPRR